MSQHIWEYGINYRGEPYKNKYTIVYDNKTYYYCKDNSVDELKQIRKSRVDNKSETNPAYVTTEIESKIYKESLLKLEIEKLKCDITCDESTISNYKTNIITLGKSLDVNRRKLNGLQDQLKQIQSIEVLME